MITIPNIKRTQAINKTNIANTTPNKNANHSNKKPMPNANVAYDKINKKKLSAKQTQMQTTCKFRGQKRNTVGQKQLKSRCGQMLTIATVRSGQVACFHSQ